LWAAANDDFLAGAELGGGLTVAEDRGAFVDADGGNEDGGGGGDNDGAEGEAVGADRGDAEAVDVRVDDGPAGGDVVGGGTRGGGDDDAVTEIADAGFGVGGDFDFDHVEWRAGGDDGVVQRGGDEAAVVGDLLGIRGFALRAGGNNGGLDHHAGTDGKTLREEFFELAAKVGGGETGEEAESAEVDAHERDLLLTKSPRYGQERAVASEDKDGVGFEFGEVVLAVGFDADDLDAFFQPGEKLIELGEDAVFVEVGDDEETHLPYFNRAHQGRQRGNLCAPG